MFSSLSGPSQVFQGFWTCSGLFRCIWMCADASRCISMRSDAFGRSRKNLEVKKTFGTKHQFFKIFAPWQLFNQFFSLLNKRAKLGGCVFVHHGNKALKLCSCSKWIKIGFDEANIALHDWANISNPVFLRLFVYIDITILEMFNICVAHVLLVLIPSKI